jgi:hypothetical protein
MKRGGVGWIFQVANQNVSFLKKGGLMFIDVTHLSIRVPDPFQGGHQ